jgi:lysophospholipase L1-like esterase
MKKKYYYIIILLILITLSAYLFFAHFYIYQQIKNAGLTSPDITHTYMVNNNPNIKKISYSALGDSLTAGVGVDEFKDSFPYILADKLAKNDAKVDLKIFAYPGAKTADLIKDLLPGAIASQPDIITLLIGTNDMHGNISLKDFEKKYRFILQELKENTKAKIYAISVPFLGTESLLLPPYDFYFNQQTKEYNEIIKNLADVFQVEYVDIATPTADLFKKRGSYCADDEFHPSAAGYALWSKIIYDSINQ